MPGVAENSLELPSHTASLSSQRTLLANLEINSTCGFSRCCGSRCLLNVVNAGAGTPLDPANVQQIAEEFICSPFARRVRHLALVGMEPTESDILHAVLRLWHETSADIRPGSIGIITAGAGALRKAIPQLAFRPLSWLVISMDTAAVGLRTGANNVTLLAAARECRRAGGTETFGVNTLLNGENLDAVSALGRELLASGAVPDQWSLGSFLQPIAGVMRPIVNTDQMRRAINRLASEFGDTGMRLLFDLDPSTLSALVGDENRMRVCDRGWRFEYNITDRVKLIATNPNPGYFLRCRWDGQLLSKDDFKQVGLTEGSYGPWRPGRVAQLLSEFPPGSERRRMSEVDACSALFHATER